VHIARQPEWCREIVRAFRVETEEPSFDTHPWDRSRRGDDVYGALWQILQGPGATAMSDAQPPRQAAGSEAAALGDGGRPPPQPLENSP
jgi:hypothetical protein